MVSHDIVEPHSTMPIHNHAELMPRMAAHESADLAPTARRDRSVSLSSVSSTDSYVVIYTPTSSPPQSPSLTSASTGLPSSVTKVASREEIIQYSHDIGKEGKPLSMCDISKYFQDHSTSGFPLHAPTRPSSLLPSESDLTPCLGISGKSGPGRLFSLPRNSSLKEYISGLTNLANDADRFDEIYPKQKGYREISRLVRDEIDAAKASLETYDRKIGFQKFYENQLSLQKAATTAFRQTGHVTHIDPGPTVKIYGAGMNRTRPRSRPTCRQNLICYKQRAQLGTNIELAKLGDPSPLYDQLHKEVGKWSFEEFWQNDRGPRSLTTDSQRDQIFQLQEVTKRLADIIQDKDCQSLDGDFPTDDQLTQLRQITEHLSDIIHDRSHQPPGAIQDLDSYYFRYPDVRDKVAELVALQIRVNHLTELDPARSRFVRTHLSLNTEILFKIRSRHQELQPLQKNLLLKDFSDLIEHFKRQIEVAEKHSQMRLDRKKKQLTHPKSSLSSKLYEQHIRNESETAHIAALSTTKIEVDLHSNSVIAESARLKNAAADVVHEVPLDSKVPSPTLGASNTGEIDNHISTDRSQSVDFGLMQTTVMPSPESIPEPTGQKREYIVKRDEIGCPVVEPEPRSHNLGGSHECIGRETAVNVMLEEYLDDFVVVFERREIEQEQTKTGLETKVHELEDLLLNETWKTETRTKEYQKELVMLTEENEQLKGKVADLRKRAFNARQ